MRVIGMISGTSHDGIDVAVCRIDGHAQDTKIDLLAFDTIAYPDAVRAELLRLYDDQTHAVARVCALNVVVGEAFADAAMFVLDGAGIDGDLVEVIGSHGQTIWHQPETDPENALLVPSTLQIGEASVIAAKVGAPVIADFRVADMAVGGQGAPRAPELHRAVFYTPTVYRGLQNNRGHASRTASRHTTATARSARAARSTTTSSRS